MAPTHYVRTIGGDTLYLEPDKAAQVERAIAANASFWLSGKYIPAHQVADFDRLRSQEYGPHLAASIDDAMELLPSRAEHDPSRRAAIVADIRRKLSSIPDSYADRREGYLRAVAERREREVA